MLEPRYFHVVKQHFAEGLFNKQLSMQQALELAYLIMAHVPVAQRHSVQLNPESKPQLTPPKIKPEILPPEDIDGS